MLERLHDTIVAVASPPGHGTLGIVRLSGPNAVAIADRMADTTQSLAEAPASTRRRGHVVVDGDFRLPAEFYVFRKPHSYTRQNMVEIHTIGSPVALEAVRARAVELAALPAEPGEFTARAFITGRIDLTRAQAVGAIIRAESDTQLRASRRMWDGALRSRVTAARDALAKLLALVEADIDFAEEPIDFITPAELFDRLAHIATDLAGLQRTALSTERMEVLPRILLLGPPNAGKSSLMNVLSGTCRAICAAAAGTTRDVLSAPIRLGRGEALLLDAAGVDESADEIIAKGRANALAAAEQVDLVCVTVDASVRCGDDVRNLAGSIDGQPVIIAANKSDLLSEDQRECVSRTLWGWGVGPVCMVSALTGLGLKELSAAMTEKLATATETVGSESILLDVRQRTAIDNASEAIDRSVALAGECSHTTDCADLLAFEIREALDALGAVTGAVTTEDLLGQVFANFCIGK